MTPALELEILDLRHFPAASLRSLLGAEIDLWRERLDWDYRASADLLLQYLDSRVLPGFVALEAGKVTGYVFCVYEENKAVIGDVFARPLPGSEDASREVERRLLEHLIEMLQNSPGVGRIEAQLLLHPHGIHADVFTGAGFEVHRRLFMDIDLHKKRSTYLRTMPAGLILRPWSEEDFTAAGHLISSAYSGHLDAHINDQYRTVSGSLRFLHNIVRFPGCGIFDPAASRVLVRAGRTKMAGLLLCSRVRQGVGHVTQVCVEQQSRGLGLGRLLIEDCAANLRSRGSQFLTLTVTQSNEHAVRLYEDIGFREKHSFDAMVWTKGGEPASQSRTVY